VASEKGGVGKSVVTRTLIDWLRLRGDRVAAFDTDGGVGSTLRVLGLRDAKGALIERQNPVEGIGYYSGRADDERNMGFIYAKVRKATRFGVGVQA
jgi:cellulose biosynthesis protein BcsQ